MWRLKSLLLALAVVAAGPARTSLAGVVVNEIFYNAPDDLDDLQWVEVHNTSDEAVDLGGWTLDDGKVFTFPAKTTLGGNGYLVVALSPERFGKVYGGHGPRPVQAAAQAGRGKARPQGRRRQGGRYRPVQGPRPVARQRRRLLGVPRTHLPHVRRRHAGQLGRLAAPGDAEAGRHAREAERELLRHAPARRHAGGRADRPPAVPAPPGGSRRHRGREGGHAPVPGRRRRHRGEGGEPPDDEGGGRPVRGEHSRPGGGGAGALPGEGRRGRRRRPLQPGRERPAAHPLGLRAREVRGGEDPARLRHPRRAGQAGRSEGAGAAAVRAARRHGRPGAATELRRVRPPPGRAPADPRVVGLRLRGPQDREGDRLRPHQRRAPRERPRVQGVLPQGPPAERHVVGEPRLRGERVVAAGRGRWRTTCTAGPAARPR